MSISTFIWRAISVLLVIVLLSPLALVILFSFTSRALSNFPITGFSLRWWEEMLQFPDFWVGLTNSLLIGLAVGVSAAIIGTMTAMGLVAMPQRTAQLVIVALSVPLMLPPLFLGVMLLVWYLFLDLELGLGTVVLSHLLFALPFIVIVVYARLASFDMRIVEAARDLGATPIKAFFTVTLPVIQPIVIGAGLMAVALSVDDFVLTSFTIGGGNTLPLLVMSTLRRGVTPMTNAVGTLLIVTSVAATLGALTLTKYRG